ncbi:MAG: polysaccharide lyase [Verrucomicrobiota bacterium]
MPTDLQNHLVLIHPLLRTPLRFILSLACLFPLAASAEPVFSLPVTTFPLGELTKRSLKAHSPNLLWARPYERAHIIPDSDSRILRVTYPAGAIGSRESGAQMLFGLPPALSYRLSYEVRFSDSFEWTHGGKLPGLTSGGSTYTGGHRPDGKGWSARFMWRPEGSLVVYLYDLDIKSHGRDLVVPETQLQRGTWHRLEQRIDLSPNSPEGRIRVWVDGELCLNRQGLRFRQPPHGQIDSFYFSTFYGGSTARFAPRATQAIDFRKIEITRPGDSRP